jgi:hypothetical protein
MDKKLVNLSQIKLLPLLNWKNELIIVRFSTRIYKLKKLNIYLSIFNKLTIFYKTSDSIDLN